MYKLYRKFFPQWYYNREFKRLDPLVRKLAVPFEPPYLQVEEWGPPLSHDTLGDLYAFIFFGTPHSCTDEFIVSAADYMRQMAEEKGFDKTHDFIVYFERQRRKFRKRMMALIKSEKEKSKQNL